MNEPEKLIRVCRSACYVSYTEIRCYESNPRIDLQYEPAKLMDLTQSIIHNSLFRPFIVWWQDDGERFTKGDILAGNQRYKALSGLFAIGYKTVIRDADGSLEYLGDKVPIIRFTGSEDVANRIILRDNRESGDWDYQELGIYLRDFIDDDMVHLAGFTEQESSEIRLRLLSPDELREAMLDNAGDESESAEDDFDPRLTVTFPVTDDQHETIEDALARANVKVTDEMLERNSDRRANALAIILSQFKSNY